MSPSPGESPALPVEPGRVLRPGLSCLFLLLSACVATPPVQEMSDARQAIAAAREAGAPKYAGDRLQVAEVALADAEEQLRDGVYRSARRAAVTAKESAIDALLKTRSLRDAEAVRIEPTGPAPTP